MVMTGFSTNAPPAPRQPAPLARAGRWLAGLVMLAVLLAAAGVWVPAASANHDPECYLVGGYAPLVLTRVNKGDLNPATNEATIGPTGTTKSDGATLQPRTGTLFSVNTNMYTRVGYLGTLNLSTGAFITVSQPFGTGSGALGSVTFYDISGLTFDPVSGALYALHVRTGDGAPDALFRVNPATGQHINEAFGTGRDYVPVGPHPTYPALYDVDDITIDPTDGQMYGIINNSGSGDRLIKINKATGAVTDVGAFGVSEVEGLSFDAHGRLWATAGGGPTGDPANKLYEVNKATGAAVNGRGIDNNGNYEAIACLTAAPDVGLAVAAGGSTTWPGGVAAFRLAYRNSGNAAASGVTLTETLPQYTTFNAASSSPGWQRVGDTATFVLNVGSLAPGATGSAVFAVTVNTNIPGTVRTISNTASVGHDGQAGADLNPGDNTSSGSISVASASSVRRVFLPLGGR